MRGPFACHVSVSIDHASARGAIGASELRRSDRSEGATATGVCLAGVDRLVNQLNIKRKIGWPG
jgi:hypothetical protein